MQSVVEVYTSKLFEHFSSRSKICLDKVLVQRAGQSIGAKSSKNVSIYKLFGSFSMQI